jgi:hypothetical protein
MQITNTVQSGEMIKNEQHVMPRVAVSSPICPTIHKTHHINMLEKYGRLFA